ncbi:hypothetical protein [Aquimarina sp. 2201CG14-23]|uniref:hypothetical protein n=1 Tax=Aquimarina mycalae TaxID=3040073 RepID=UPI002477D793|nr:hypothetical protein [Aquimarina sp. 2201CG14-23]MDH7444739.1 hypothetical protein [Aquimarina sp. 2201CG14-23]
MKRLLLLFFLLALSTNITFGNEFVIVNDIAEILNNSKTSSYNDKSDEEFEKIEVLNATFDYTPSEFCQGDIDPIPNVTTSGGTFTSTAGLVFVNSTTGIIDLDASTPGTYPVTYTVASGSPLTFMQNVTIHSSDPTTITYNASGTTSTTLCTSGSSPAPVISGIIGGEFSTSSTGLVFGGGGGSEFIIEPVESKMMSTSATGEIDLASSTPGTYVITYTAPGGCVITTHTVKIVVSLDPNFSYASDSYCSDDINPIVPILDETMPETANQVFLAGAGLAMNASTGVISPGSSTPGTYFVNRFVTNNCQGGTSSASPPFIINIVSSGDPSFSYENTSFCVTDTNPVATISGTGGGVFTSTDADLVFANNTTGEINLAATPVGTYPIVYELSGTCAATSTPQNITITGADASFNYAATVYCSADVDPLPSITGISGGTFSNSSSSGLSINPTSGLIDLDTSTVGAHEITYTLTGACTVSSTFNLTISTSGTAEFNYSSSIYCKSDANPIANITGTTGGVFSSTDMNLVFVDVNTGEIDVVATPLGTYPIVYEISGSCGATSTPQNITVTNEDASFSYAATDYCSGDIDPSPTITGTAGGTFTNSSTSGLSIDAASGLIDLDTSTAGVHEITYTTPGICAVSSTFDLTIVTSSSGDFNFPASVFCASDSNPTPSISGTGGGTFSSTTGLVFVSTSTGEIDLSVSTPGMYTIDYVIADPCGITIQKDITINSENPTLSFETSIDDATYVANPAEAIDVEIGKRLELRLPEPFNGTVSWTGPDSFSAVGTEILVSNDIQLINSGTYTANVSFDIACGSAPTTYNFDVNVLNDIVRVSPKVFLQGAMLTSADNFMRDDLRTLGYLPNNTPYSDGASVDGTIFNDAALDEDNIVDWVLVELRDATTNTTIIDSQSAFVQRDGDIVDVNGNPEVTMTATSGGSYYVVIKHRNHLGIMTDTPVILDVVTTTLDFRNGSQPTFGSNAQTSNGMPVGTIGMCTGDANQDGSVSIIGSGNDNGFLRDTILNDPGNFFQLFGFIVSGYNNADINLSGGVQLIGSGNDAGILINNILNHPNNLFFQLYGFVITEQLP